jgi:hypothetical protein
MTKVSREIRISSIITLISHDKINEHATLFTISMDNPKNELALYRKTTSLEHSTSNKYHSQSCFTLSLHIASNQLIKYSTTASYHILKEEAVENQAIQLTSQDKYRYIAQIKLKKEFSQSQCRWPVNLSCATQHSIRTHKILCHDDLVFKLSIIMLIQTSSRDKA